MIRKLRQKNLESESKLSFIVDPLSATRTTEKLEAEPEEQERRVGG